MMPDRDGGAAGEARTRHPFVGSSLGRPTGGGPPEAVAAGAGMLQPGERGLGRYDGLWPVSCLACSRRNAAQRARGKAMIEYGVPNGRGRRRAANEGHAMSSPRGRPAAAKKRLRPLVRAGLAWASVVLLGVAACRREAPQGASPAASADGKRKAAQPAKTRSRGAQKEAGHHFGYVLPGSTHYAEVVTGRVKVVHFGAG